MDASRFDAVSRFFAQRRLTRRQVLAQSGAGLAAASFAATGLAAVTAAQDATPEPAATDAEHGPEMLFLQSFQAGTIAPKDGAEGRYTVTLKQGLGQTVYFSDRPDRLVGTTPTGQFLDGLGFPPDDPPNAALVVETPSGETDIAVVELFAPVYDPTGPAVTYEAAVLDDWEDSLELGFSTATTDLAAIDSSFGAAYLFIDGCPDGVITCQAKDGVAGSFPSPIFGGFCYSASDKDCLPCKPWNPSFADAFGSWQEACNAEFFTNCAGACEPLGVSRKEN